MTMKQTIRQQLLLGSKFLTSNSWTATIEELLEMVFSVVCAMAVAMQRWGKHASAARVELKQ
jgi:hypothetical protein